MTVPTYDMNSVMAAARQRMIADPDFSALIGVDVGKSDTGAWTDAWIFRNFNEDGSPLVNPAGSGMAAITMDMREPAFSVSQYHTLISRQLRFYIYTDPTRSTTDSTLIKTRDAEIRCSRIADAIRNIFNDVANRVHFWNATTYIISSVLYEDLHILDVPGQDGIVEGTISFALELG